MSFIQLTGIGDTKEPTVAPDGRYPLVITSATVKESKELKEGQTKKGKNIMCVIEIEGEGAHGEKFANIFHYISLPDGQDKDKDQTKLLMAKRFFVQFNVPMDGDGVEIEQIAGCRAEGNLGNETFEDKPRNVLKVDRMPSED